MSPETQTPPIDHSQEAQRHVIQDLHVGYLGLRARLQDRLVRNADETIEKMDHKDALYADLGQLALTGRRGESPTADGRLAMPRSMIERRTDRKLSKRAFKRAVAETHAYRATMIFGPQNSLPGMNKRERMVAKMGLRRRLGGVGANQEGQLLAGEYKTMSTGIDGSILKLGEQIHKRASKQLRKQNRKIESRVVQREWQEEDGSTRKLKKRRLTRSVSTKRIMPAVRNTRRQIATNRRAAHQRRSESIKDNIASLKNAA